MRNLLKNKIWFFVVLIVTGLIYTFSFIRFDNLTKTAEGASMQQTLEITAQHVASDIGSSFNSRFEALNAMSSFLAVQDFQVFTGLNDILVLARETGKFKYTGYADINGSLTDSEGHIVDVSEAEFFKAALRGESNASSTLNTELYSSQKLQLLAVPVISSGYIRGVVIGACSTEDIISSIENTLSNHVYFHILDDEGNYLARSHHVDSVLTGKTIWEDLELCALTVGSQKQIRYNFSNHFSGFFRYEIGDRQRSVYYSPLETTGGYLLASVNDQYSHQMTDRFSVQVTHILVESLIAFILLLLGVFIYNQIILAKGHKTLQRTESRRALMQTAIEHSNQILFEYDIERCATTLRIARDYPRNEGEIFTNLPETMAKRNLVHPNSQEDLKRLFKEIEVNDYCEADLLLKYDSRFLWFNLLLQNVYDNHGVLINTVGVATNIDDQKRREIDLAEQADTDQLTGLFNASALKRKMANILKSDNADEMQSFFVILDLDNFKKINDTFGHAYGDRVLMDVADTIRRNISKQGFACRLGGDEFAFVLRGYNEAQAKNALSHIVRQLNRIYESGGIEITVSASAGAVEAHVYGTTFDELYKKSDKMLYNIKRTTKNDYLFYPGS